MKPSLIAQVFVRYAVWIMLLVSLLIFWRGHQLPGGGFIGGLVGAAGLIIHGLVMGFDRTRHLLRGTSFLTICSCGLLVGILGSIWGVLVGAGFFVGVWNEAKWIGTPVLFDFGVYLVVLGGLTGVVDALYPPDREYNNG